MSDKPKVILEFEKQIKGGVKNFKLDNYGEIESITLVAFFRELKDLNPIVELKNLKFLSISRNRSMDISPLSRLKNLKSLELIDSNIRDISAIGEIKTLESLNLSENNSIKDYSPLANLESLTSLTLNDCLVSDLSQFQFFKRLSYLDLSNNNIEDIGFLRNLFLLKSLELSVNNISNLDPIKDLYLLKSLHLSTNKIENINKLENLLNLNKLLISSNKISDIKPLTNLTQLKHLEASNNNLKNINSIRELKNLEYLDLSLNKITSSSLKPLSKAVGFRFLSFLNLSSNDIKDVNFLSDIIINSKIKNIKFDSEKKYFFNLKNNYYEEYLDLTNNPLEFGLKNALRSGGKKSLLNYLNSRGKGTLRIEEAKMVLLGEPRAGKTTLQKYLMGLPVNENEESTPDIQISSWKPFENDFSRKDRKNIKINLWDFGGQEIQYSLHKLFMTTDTLYIIVLDSTKDQNPQKYLEFLENYAPKSPFIIINNYGDAPTSNTFKIDENYLRETYNGRNEKLPVLKKIFNRVSVLKAAQNEPSWRKIMNEVEETIKTELLQLENLNKEFPTEYLNVKQAVEEEYTKPTKHYITMSYYRERCRELQITDDEELRIAILLYLNQIGVLRYFKDSPITDRHILNPKWLIDGAYSLIIDAETQLNQGVLSKEEALRILKKSEKFKFFEDEAVFIFKTMNFYGLLHFEEKENKIYIPIRFGSNQPIALHEFYERGQHYVFEFKGDIPEDIMPTMIVRHFSEIKNRHYWSKGAVFTSGEVRILAKIEDRNIYFYIIGKYHQTYFGVLRNTLIKTLDLLPGLLYDEMVDFEFEGKKIKAKYNDLIVILNENWGDYRDYSTKTKIEASQIVQILGGYFSNREINSITNNYYAPVYQSDNLYQQINILNQLKILVETTAEPKDQLVLKELMAELEAFRNEEKDSKKENLGKKILAKIKKISTDVADDVVKDKLKELFPSVLKSGMDFIKNLDLDGIMQIFGGI